MENKTAKTKVVANGLEITIRQSGGAADYISLTDIAKFKSDDPNAVIQNWMRNRETIEFLGLWESLFNPDFNPAEFEGFRSGAGSNTFTLSPKKWIEATGAIGIDSKAGRYGGTFAHHDIAYEFMSWISPAFKLYFIQDYQRLKEDESQKRLEKPAQVFLLPSAEPEEPSFEAMPSDVAWNPEYEELEEEDFVNVALFGMTQAQAEKAHPALKGLMRENTSIGHIIVHWSLRKKYEELSTDMPKKELLTLLNKLALEQMRALEESSRRNQQEEALPEMQG